MTNDSKDAIIRELVEALQAMMEATEFVSGAPIAEAYHKARVALAHAEAMR